MRICIPAGGGKALHIRNLKEVRGVDRVIISEIDPWAYGNFVADASYILPRFDDEGFLPAFERMLKRDPFDVLLPTHDVALKLFSDLRDEVASLPFRMAINPKPTIDLVADKLATYRFFLENQIPSRTCYLAREFFSLGDYAYPYFLKPRFISLRGSDRALYSAIEDQHDMERLRRKIAGQEDDYVVQEFHRGQEINIDFFCDGDGLVRSVVPLRRLGMGVSRGITRGEIITDHRFEDYVRRIASAARFWGPNNAQAYVDPDGKISFTEINGRFSGSSVLVKESGVDFFSYLVRLLADEPFEVNDHPRPMKMCCWEKPIFFTDSPAIRL